MSTQMKVFLGVFLGVLFGSIVGGLFLPIGLSSFQDNPPLREGILMVLTLIVIGLTMPVFGIANMVSKIFDYYEFIIYIFMVAYGLFFGFLGGFVTYLYQPTARKKNENKNIKTP